MERSNIIQNPSNKNLICKQYFQKNMFDEDFLAAKDKALSPIVLSDVISRESIKKDPKTKESNFKFNDETAIKYGSNIIYIESKSDDNDEEFCEIINKQVKKIIILKKLCKKSTSNIGTEK